MNRAVSLAFAAVLLSACSAASDMAGQSDNLPMQVPDTGSALPETDGDPLDQDGVTDSGPQTGGDTDPDSSGSENVETPVTDEFPDEQSVDSLLANASSITCEAALEGFRDTMLALVNEARQVARQCGTSSAPATGTVQWNEGLATAARNHAVDMATINFFDHTGSDGLGVSDRVESAGYEWRAVGENIAAGQFDMAEAHEGWLESPGHCRNIMNDAYTEVGAACVVNDDSDYRRYWVVVFGDQR